jgi:bifunctional UDP-N-acetylglucosamine pyrophosphorylase/glucosamine-1-phosphate N-acetyltransferase
MQERVQIKELSPEYFFDKPYGFPFHEIIKKTDYIWELLKLKDEILKEIKHSIEGVIEKEAVIIPPVHIGKGTIIHSNAVVRGPAWIGENCSIRYHALIRNGTIIGNQNVIGHCSEVKNSILFNGVKMQGLYTGDSILGAYSRVSHGCVFENRRFDQGEIKIKPSKYLPITNPIPTGRKFFGCILGDYSRLGGVLTTYPGTLIGKHTWILGNQHIGGKINLIPSNKLVKDANNPKTWKDKNNFILDSGFRTYEWI